MALLARVLAGLLLLTGAAAVIALAWRWASRQWQLPCPASLAWLLERNFYDRFLGTQTTLSRIGLAHAAQVLEIGPGPGRLLIPAAEMIGPGGTAVGLDIQPQMIKRLLARARRAGIDNLRGVVGDAALPHFAPESFDLVFLCTVLGEIPRREAALAQAFAVLRPGGRLSITEMLPDPHFQSRSTVERLAVGAGFVPLEVAGNWRFFTFNFRKPAAGATSAAAA